MNNKFIMFDKVVSSRYHDKMIRSAEPLNSHLGINHIWYNKVTYSGHYSYFGTKTDWSAYCSEHMDCVQHIPYVSNPDSAKEGVHLFGLSPDEQLQDILENARKKFKTNFNLQISRAIPEGIEGFGFGCTDNSPKSYDRLLNNLSLLTLFIKEFQKINAPIFSIIDEYRVDLNEIPGFTGLQEIPLKSFDNNRLLKNLGVHYPSLTQRELQVLEYCANGFPASFIANQMFLGIRTIETYIASLKDKLQCESKVDLIQRAKEIVSLNSTSRTF